ncbi:MAG: potassium channel family protein [Muribaculaceae bacterium]|nr:potassium channel family protein [Muribaculaceae bacterium]
MSISDRIRHFFHVVSNVRPIVWIGVYIVCVPLFALFYNLVPDGQFRIPDGGGTDYGSWLYYSIVTITTLGFGDYTPMGPGAQAITAIEVMVGLSVMGFFLNSVGAMKSEIDVESALEKQRRLHDEEQKTKLLQNVPAIIHNINTFLSYCYAATTPRADRATQRTFNPDFEIEDMKDLYRPTGMSMDYSTRPAVERLMEAASATSLALDSLQTHVDLTQWPELLEDCFTFVADCQMFSHSDIPSEESVKAHTPDKPHPLYSLSNFIKSTSQMALNIEAFLSKLSAA